MTYVAVITGASSGIGEALAKRLTQEPDTHLVMVARRAERLRELAMRFGAERTTVVAGDITDEGFPARLAAVIEERFGSLNLLVNNAGARFAGEFPETGWETIERHMRVNFDAQVRITQALLPLLKRAAAAGVGAVASGDVAAGGGAAKYAGVELKSPAAIVNISSTSARVSRRGTGGYSASKAALSAWADSLARELAPLGVHVGTVLPGFVSTEGFPQQQLKDNPRTRLLVSDVSVVVDAVIQTGPGGVTERYAPRYYWIFAALRILAPGLLRRLTSGNTFTPSTGSR